MKVFTTVMLALAFFALQAQTTKLIASKDAYAGSFTANTQMVRTDLETKIVDVKTEIRIAEADRRILVYQEGTEVHSYYIEAKAIRPVTDFEAHIHYALSSGDQFILKVGSGEIREVMYVATWCNIIYSNNNAHY